MWRIFVPAASNEGEEYTVAEHNVWDALVREITGGLTIHKTAKGQWVSPKGELFVEKMIPVDVACTRDQINQIAKMTAEFYKQQAVLCYKMSDEVLITYSSLARH